MPLLLDGGLVREEPYTCPYSTHHSTAIARAHRILSPSPLCAPAPSHSTARASKHADTHTRTPTPDGGPQAQDLLRRHGSHLPRRRPHGRAPTARAAALHDRRATPGRSA